MAEAQSWVPGRQCSPKIKPQADQGAFTPLESCACSAPATTGMATALAVSDGTANLVVMTPILLDGDLWLCVGDPADPQPAAAPGFWLLYLHTVEQLPTEVAVRGAFAVFLRSSEVLEASRLRI